MTTPQKPFNVLFLCTHNSARSILAEALLNHLGQGRFKAYSAGSSPRDKQQPNPLALQVLNAAGVATEGLRSKSWDEFAAQDSPQFDFIFTVCDNAAGEVCPVWIGQPVSAHWGIEDPAVTNGSDDDKRRAFFLAFNRLQRRISLFLALPLDKLDRLTLKTELQSIGKSA